LKTEQQAAIVATAAAVTLWGAHSVLSALIDRERSHPRGKGNKPLWLRRLGLHTARELAAAILYHVFESRLRADSADVAPYALSIGTALGADFMDDAGEGPVIGVQLLHLAAQAGVIEPLANDNGVRVVIAQPTFDRLKAIVDGAAPHIRRKVRTVPPRGVETKQPHRMLIPRPDVPMRVLEAADKVQGTAWRVNSRVLDVLRSADVQLGMELTEPEEKKLAKRSAVAQAAELLNVEKFYYPVFLDFRGRMYQRGSLLTYTSGTDYARGLLEFADGAVLDAAGLAWLSWHMAQMWGDSNAKRLEFGNGSQWKHLAEVEALRWQDAKEAAQFLAARFAWLEALQGKPCHLPVRLDASCSGLQHLALLARDTELAQTVNLWGDSAGLPRREIAWLELPAQSDFYSLISEMCGAERDQVKAVLVPMLYTAGEKACAEALAELRTDGRSRRPTKADRQLSAQIRAAAQQSAPRGVEVLRWFGEVARAHNGEEMGRAIAGSAQRMPEPVRWTTPSGFEAIQDYRVVDKNPTHPDRQVQITVDGRRLQLVKRFMLSAYDVAQQLISLPSSLVHSLDAAMLVEIVAGADIEQWAVAHDAFGVPAGKAWDLTAACQAAIEVMYGPDRLAEWVAQWRASGINVSDPPGARGSLPGQMLDGLRTIG